MTELERITINMNKFYSERYKDYGINSRNDLFIWKTNKEYGETINLINYTDKNHLSKRKGTGYSEVIVNKDRSNKERVKYIPPRFDIEDLFKFDYNEMFNYKTKEWWRISLLRHRYSDKDMKSKGIVPIFTMING